MYLLINNISILNALHCLPKILMLRLILNQNKFNQISHNRITKDNKEANLLDLKIKIPIIMVIHHHNKNNDIMKEENKEKNSRG